MIDLRNNLDAILKEGQNARDVMMSKWRSNSDLYAGNIWNKVKMPMYKSKPVLNYIAHTIERKTAILTDTRPSIMVVPRNDIYKPAANVIQDSVEALWDEISIDLRLMRLMITAQVFGLGFGAVTWNKDLDNGRGDVDLSIIDPRYVCFDPYIADIDYIDRGEYLVLEYQIPLSEAILRFPKSARALMEKASDRVDDAKAKLFDRLQQFVFNTSASSGFGTDVTKSAIERVLVEDFWLKDRTSIKAGNKNVQMYVGGRRIIRCNGLVVYDKPNAYIDGKFPIDSYGWRLSLDSPYPMSEVDMLRSPQESFLKLVALIIDHALLMTNAIWIGDKNALTPDEWDNLTNRPGDKIKVRPGAQLRRETGSPMPQIVFNAVELLSKAQEELSGMTDVMLGMKPGRVSSGIGIEALQGAAQAVIRLKARQLEATLNRIGYKFISRILQFYDKDRVKLLVRNAQDVKQFTYVKETVEKHGNSATILDNIFFRVVPGSSMSMSQVQKAMIAMQLYQLGILSDEDLLKAVSWEDPKGTIERAKKQKEEKSKEEAAMQGDKTIKPPNGQEPPPVEPEQEGGIERGVPGQRNAGAGIVY